MFETQVWKAKVFETQMLRSTRVIDEVLIDGSGSGLVLGMENKRGLDFGRGEKRVFCTLG